MKINIIKDEDCNTFELKKWRLVLKFLTIKMKYYLSSDIQSKVKQNDMSVREFLELFVNKDDHFLNNNIDPFLSGIWAGKIEKLSAKSSLSAMMTFLKNDKISQFPKSNPNSIRGILLSINKL